MLQLAVIRENKERVIKALAKRNLDAQSLVDTVLDLDEKRRATQVELDNILSESNLLSKEIGIMMKSGEKSKAEIVRQKTLQLKEKSKDLAEKLDIYTSSLAEELYKIPNTPADIVPEGKTPEDNLNIHEEGTVPTLHEGALPHWELVKKYDIIE